MPVFSAPTIPSILNVSENFLNLYLITLKANSVKKLELKKTPVEKKVTKANYILTNAKEEIKKFIKMEAVLLYKAIYGCDPDFAEEGGWTICTGDLCDNLYVNIKADNSYLDVENICYERCEMSEIIVLLDDTIIVRDEDGEEWTDSEISLEDLAHVSDILELTYLNKIK